MTTTVDCDLLSSYVVLDQKNLSRSDQWLEILNLDFLSLSELLSVIIIYDRKVDEIKYSLKVQ